MSSPVIIEVEAKARIANPDEMCRMLEERGAVFEREVLHRDTYYSHPCRDYSSTDEAVRIRTIIYGDTQEQRITYKGPKMDNISKTREEVEVVISGPGANELLRRLRFKEVETVEKKRRFYSLPPLKITVDNVKGLGDFIEVESTGGEDWTRTRDGVLVFMHSLGCGEMERKSYLEMVLEKEQ